MTRRILCLLLVLLSLGLAPAAVHASDPAAVTPMTLEEALRIALADSSAVLEAAANLRAQEEALRGARADRLPKLSAAYSYASLRDQPYAVFGPNQVPTSSQDIYHWDLTLRQPLFTGFALSAKQEMEALGLDIRAMEKQQAELQVAMEVKNAYYTILLNEKFRKVADEAVAGLTAHARDATLFYEKGIIPYNDLLKSQVALADARQEARKAASRESMAVSAFNILLRLPIDRATTVVDSATAGEPPSDLAPLLAAALAQRPELRAMRLMVENGGQATRLARSAYYPAIDLVGRYERNGDDPAARNNDYSNSENSSITVQASWQLFEWGRQRAEVNRSLHQQEAMAAKLTGFEDSVRLEVQRAFLNLQVAAANIGTAEEAVAQARENERIATLQYKENLATSTDVLDARTFLTRAETNYFSALYGFGMARAELDRVVGSNAAPAFGL